MMIMSFCLLMLLWHPVSAVPSPSPTPTPTPTPTPSTYGWLDGWDHRKNHTITAASGAGEDYQIRLTVYYGSGNDSGSNVYLNGHCQPDFDDARFTDDDGVTPLDYWLETKTDNVSAVFWVEVEDDLSTYDRTIYVYYGNRFAASESNGTNTFLFFDDFSGDLSKWIQRSGIWSIDSSNYLKTPTRDENQIVTASFIMKDGRIRYHFKQDSVVTWITGSGLSCIARSPNASNYYRVQYWDCESDTYEMWKYVNSSHAGLNGTVITADANWHTDEFLLYGSTLKGYLDDSYELEATDTTFTTNSYLGFRYGGLAGKYYLIDWIAVGKYVSPEPAQLPTSWGSQENSGSPTPAPTPTPSPTSPTPTLVVSCKSSTSYSGFNVQITGSLTFNGTGISEAPILLSYSVTGGKSWQDLTLVNTGSDGSYLVAWMPSVTGNYLLKAAWEGDEIYSNTSTIVNLAVTPFAEQSVFSVTSNSTISEFSFNSTSRELRFGVSGSSGTTGYVDVYIPKSLIGNISSLQVYLDGNQTEYTAASQSDSWFLHFVYQHSTHVVTINLGSPAQTNENPLANWIFYGSLLAIVIIVIIVIGVVLALKRGKNVKEMPLSLL
jgi:hypothetical protein